MMKNGSAIALAVIAGGLAFASARPTADPAETLLLAAIAAPSSVSYVGVVESVRMGSRQSEASVYRVEHLAPDLTRRVYTAPAALAGDCVVSKRELVFSVDPKRRRIVETRNDAVDDSSALTVDQALLRQNYGVTRTGSESYDGRPAVDLDVINKHTHRIAMVLRIDAATKIVLDQEEFAPGGTLAVVQRFEEIRYASQLPLADFALPNHYSLVQGAALEELSGRPDRVARNAGFAAREPRALPDGFGPVEGNLVEMHGVRTVHLLYSDGLRTVSLFESATASTLEATGLEKRSLRVAGRNAEYAEDGATALLAWSDGTLYYTLVGEVGLIDLPRLAESITP
jgi:negative regulator of sigma E activity